MSSSHRPPDAGRPDAPEGYDPLLDPIPMPAVQERDSDTGWAEFDSLMKEELSDPDAPPPPDFEETRPAVDFEETQPFDRNAGK